MILIGKLLVKLISDYISLTELSLIFNVKGI